MAVDAGFDLTEYNQARRIQIRFYIHTVIYLGQRALQLSSSEQHRKRTLRTRMQAAVRTQANGCLRTRIRAHACARATYAHTRAMSVHARVRLHPKPLT